ncbi:hypothetical protein DFH27DRAFT_284904 [Peziza echinospora]|nr:hypothetical protein DFH27DRAFT_284904 [Peziza echinospora]
MAPIQRYSHVVRKSYGHLSIARSRGRTGQFFRQSSIFRKTLIGSNSSLAVLPHVYKRSISTSHPLHSPNHAPPRPDSNVEDDSTTIKPPTILSETLNPLTPEQSHVLTLLKSGKNIFLTGPAGSGKSEIIKHATRYLHGIGKPYAVTASTGVAALAIGGQTIYSWSTMGKGDKSIRQYRRAIDRLRGVEEKVRQHEIVRKQLRQLGRAPADDLQLTVSEWRFHELLKARVLIVDEISMWGGIDCRHVDISILLEDASPSAWTLRAAFLMR